MRITRGRMAAFVAVVATLSLTGATLAAPSGAIPAPPPLPIQPADTTAPADTTPPETPPAADPTCPAPAGNARFVRYIYLSILERCPDAGADSYWTGRLDSGLGRWDFAEAIDMSDENIVNNNVVPIYQQILGRAPSSGELAQWSNYIRTNHADAGFIATLGSSDEFYAKVSAGAPNAVDAWLTFAYDSILDRAPDPGGAAHFSAVLDAESTPQTRLDVAMALEHSAENAGDWTGAVYGAAFGRGPDAGIGYWIGWLMGPGQWQTFRMWTQFLASSEGYTLAQTQPNPPPPHEG